MANITDLCVDVLAKIMLLLAQSTDGAAYLANNMVVCKHFMAATKTTEVLEAACFKNVGIRNRYSLFQRRNGLLCECAEAGNSMAQYLLAQIILASATQLIRIHIKYEKLHHFRDHTPKYQIRRANFRDDTAVASFMARFTPRRGFSTQPLLLHWELVKVFLIRCSMSDLCNMIGHLRNYVKYFSWRLTRTQSADVGLQIRHLINETYRGFFIDLISAMNYIGLKKRNSYLMIVEGNYYVRFINGPTFPSFQPPMHPHLEEWLDWEDDRTAFQHIRVKAFVAFDDVINGFDAFVD